MIDIDELRQQIANLVLNYPELENDEVLRADMIDGATEFSAALEILLGSLTDSNTMIEAMNIRMNMLAARRDRYKHRVEVLRSLMLRVLQAANIKKFVLPEATLSQGLSPPKVIGDPDLATLPDEYVRVVRELNKGKVREALLDGKTVEGCFLSNREPSLVVRLK